MATTRWTKWIPVLGLLWCLWRYVDVVKDRWYVFDPKELHELAQSAIAASPDDTAGMVRHIVANLTATYPSSVVRLNPNSSEWVFNNAGGAMGAMYIIHASITEYLIIYGTPLGTEGHSGRFLSDNYFNILVGEEWAFQAGAMEMERYPPGTVNVMPRGVVKQYKMHEGCFALEYMRGWIPAVLPFGYLDALTSTLDLPTLYHTTIYTAREMLLNLAIGKI